jgi:hypothetical protein
VSGGSYGRPVAAPLAAGFDRGPTPEYPEGTYYYVITDEFSFIPRLYRGTPDPSFHHGPPPGVSPPVPSELLRYRGIG